MAGGNTLAGGGSFIGSAGGGGGGGNRLGGGGGGGGGGNRLAPKPKATPAGVKATPAAGLGSALSANGAQLVSALFNQFQSAYQQAKNANLSRYQNILEGYGARQRNYYDVAGQMNNMYDARRDRILGNLEGAGAAQRQSIADQYAAAQGRVANSLISRGLFNTTVYDSLQRGLEADRGKAELSLAEQLRMQKANLDASLSEDSLKARQFMNERSDDLWGQVLDVQERRTDSYPDPALLANLALALGSSGAQPMAALTSGAGAAFPGGISPRSTPLTSGASGGYFAAPPRQQYLASYEPYSSGFGPAPQTVAPTNLIGGLAGAFGGGLGIAGGLGALGGFYGLSGQGGTRYGYEEAPEFYDY